MDIGFLYKTGPHVPLLVEEVPELYIKNVFPLLKEEKIVKDQLFLLKSVMKILVLLIKVILKLNLIFH
jgi:hypothetical protein